MTSLLLEKSLNKEKIGINKTFDRKVKMNYECKLAWVLVAGENHLVSEYKDLPPWQRPDAFCPVCKDRVILRLGPIKVHHAAHKPKVICAVTQPETALHLNVKLYIAHQLKDASELYFRKPCSGDSDGICYKSKNKLAIFCSNWDEVQVEY